MSFSTIAGEYISLYQLQRSLLKQRQEEKEQYVCQLAREREDMADKLGQLQALVMQLLGERQQLHSYQPQQTAIANHTPVGAHPGSAHMNQISGKLDSTNLEGTYQFHDGVEKRSILIFEKDVFQVYVH